MGTRSRRAIAVLSGALAALLVTAVSAMAGTYNIDQCRVDGGSTPKGVLTEWTGTGVGEYDSCASGGSFGYHLNQAPAGQVPYGTEKWFQLSVPGGAPNTTIQGVRMAYRFPSHSGNQAFLTIYANGGVVHEEQLPQDRMGVPLSLTLPQNTTSLSLRQYCSTANGAVNCSYASWSQVFQVNQARLTLAESVLPAGSIDGGTLTGTGAKSGTKTLAYSVSDADSGIERIRVRLGSTVVADVNYSADAAACPRDSWAACARDRSGQSVNVDTTQVSDGTHELTLVINDAAGNSRTITGSDVVVDNIPAPQNTTQPTASTPNDALAGRTAVGDKGAWSGTGNTYAYRWQRCNEDGQGCVDLPGATGTEYVLQDSDVGKRVRLKVTATNAEGSDAAFSESTAVIGPRPEQQDRTPRPEQPRPEQPSDRAPDNGSGASNAAQLSAFTRNNRTRINLRYGQRAELRGRLVDEANRPITNATVEVVSTPRMAGASDRREGTVETDADGNYRWTAPAGPSRVIRFGYRSNRANTQFADTSDVELLVRGSARLTAAPLRVLNGRTVTFRGKLRGERPARGIVVVLQAKVGRRWQTFATTRSIRGGRFKVKYRFRRTTGTRTYTFRARLQRESGWAYEPGESNSVRVTVRG